MSKDDNPILKPAKAFARALEYQVFVRGALEKLLMRVPPPEYPKMLLDPKSDQQALIVIGTEEFRRVPQMAAAALKAVFASSGKVVQLAAQGSVPPLAT